VKIIHLKRKDREKMKKRGFTLIELLAVIAILAILVIVAVPNVVNMYKSAKENTFKTQAQNIIKAALQRHMSDQISGSTAVRYCHGSASTDVNALDLSGNKNIYYDITFTGDNITSAKVSDNSTYNYNITASSVDPADLTAPTAGVLAIPCTP
jgi:prepilin-type N-terminal cleavage/methylation domain-containing protein